MDQAEGYSFQGCSVPTVASRVPRSNASSVALLTSSGVCQRAPSGPYVQPRVTRCVMSPAPSGDHALRLAMSASGAPPLAGEHVDEAARDTPCDGFDVARNSPEEVG